MIRSMTGFTREIRAFEWGTLTIELSSVNHRYQEISIRMPREMASFESAISGMIRSGLGRGKIRLHGEISWAPRFRALVIDRDVLAGYYSQLLTLSGDLGETSRPSLSSLLSMPGVMDSPSVLAMVEKEVGEALEDVIGNALGSLSGMREKEGGHLLKAITGYLDSFEEMISSVETYWNSKKSDLFEELRTRVTVLLEGVTSEADQGRVAQELAIMGDKWDISEEFVRSKSHCSQFRSILAGPSSEGRKLDFLLQEMNREVNTMGSKITDADLRWMVVEAKTLLEKIREQVQNVE
ncbi:MAG: YicC family protein [Synergistaceae bacterium]|nr:YicC family protein [Synergistaceae bacterium]MDD4020558.1 YicC family protein [Synergistaceae bacterium]MDD4612334.1 YicC family protein [Synergistaceae bacterium]